MRKDTDTSSPDWSEADVSGVPESDFPVACGACGASLTGLGERGSCPACGVAFERRRLLWDAHGPEAFADPPIAEGDDAPAPEDARFVTAVVAGLLGVASVPATIAIWRAVFGRFDGLAWLIAWLLIMTCAQWIVWKWDPLGGQTTASDSDRSDATP